MKSGISTIILLTASVLLSAGANNGARAQERPKTDFMIGGGFSIPISPEDFSDTHEIGFGSVIGLRKRINNILAVQGKIGVQRFLFKTGPWPGPDPYSGGEYYLIESALAIQAHLQSGKSYVKPYFFGGLGAVMMIDRKLELLADTAIVLHERNSKYGASIFIGHGYDFPLSKSVALFIEGQFISYITDRSNLKVLPVFAGIRVR